MQAIPLWVLRWSNKSMVIIGNHYPFFSEKFDSAQRNYSTHDRELTAIYGSIKYFKFLIQALNFKIYCYYKPLCHAFHEKNPLNFD